MKRSRYGTAIGTFLFIIALFVAFFYRQWFIDQYNYLTYQPSSEIQALADRDKLSDSGRRYLYMSHPEINDRNSFTSACGSHEASTAVLGCYTKRQIYIFNVTDKELDGIEEVTAAHEMLHAAYDRLSSSERKRVDTLLLAEAKKLEQDPIFSKRISVYSKLSSDEYVDELHSVIGTEIETPGSALETYYKSYFNDRQAVVAMHSKYSDVFANLQASAEQLSTSLNKQAAMINSETASYNAQAKALQADIETFNKRAATTGGFTTQAEFNQDRQILVSRTAALNTFRDQIDQRITAYNADVEKFNSMETHLTSLSNSINSNLVTAPKV